jgi:hypothetical protein
MHAVTNVTIRKDKPALLSYSGTLQMDKEIGDIITFLLYL